MDMLEKLNEAAKLPNVYYHKFITSYKSFGNDIYVFCEGNEDLNYYCEAIERQYPERKIKKCFAECKNNVIKIWEYINWNSFNKNRVLFFVDRDLSYWTGEPQYYDSNVYITDEYSFENDAVNLHMFLKCIEDIYGFANYTDAERNRISVLFNDKWIRFEQGSYDLMAYILIKYQIAHDHKACNIVMSKCLDIGTEAIWKDTVRTLPKLDYFKNQIELEEEDIDKNVELWKKKFLEEKDHYSIRGKWCLEFMIMLCNYVLENWEEFAPSLVPKDTKKPKKLVDLTHRNAMTVLGAKIKQPNSLTQFINFNLGE